MSKSIPQSLSRTRLYIVLGAISLLALASVLVVYAAISLSTTTAYTQNFDGLGIPTSATPTPAPSLPADFRVDALTTVRTVGTFAGAGTTIPRAGGANLSTSASNGIYNFGAGTTTFGGSDRA